MELEMQKKKSYRKTYTVKQWTTESGLVARIVRCDTCLVLEGFPTECEQWYNGYVMVTSSHDLYKKDYQNDELNLEVHGGLTFSRKFSVKDAPEKEEWWFGFDCHHFCDDYMHPIRFNNQSIEYVTQECEELAKQLQQKDQTND